MLIMADACRPQAAAVTVKPTETMGWLFIVKESLTGKIREASLPDGFAEFGCQGPQVQQHGSNSLGQNSQEILVAGPARGIMPIGISGLFCFVAIFWDITELVIGPLIVQSIFGVEVAG